jgi:hypothetical protein
MLNPFLDEVRGRTALLCQLPRPSVAPRSALVTQPWPATA